MHHRHARNSLLKHVTMQARTQCVVAFGLALSVMALVAHGCAGTDRHEDVRGGPTDAAVAKDDLSSVAVDEGRNIFRFETFGDEGFWTDTARLHEVVRESVSPATALKVGLKVDVDVLPPEVVAGIKSGTVDLEDPATTVTLLELNAVVGLQGTVTKVNGKDTLVKIGITCALCHSTVDDSLSKGIGRRRDGWPNRDLNVGAIIALSPALTPEQKLVYDSWGPGKYDPRYNIDGKSTPVVLPPTYGLAAVKNETYTAEGPISYWNAYVAVTQMHGLGSFTDARLGLDLKHSPDMVQPKLAALRVYQHSLVAPRPPQADTDAPALERGRKVFGSHCVQCHVGGTGTDNNTGALHTPSETGMNARYALRSATKMYRTTPLRALWQHPPYFHDGSAATLADVVEHYDRVRSLQLSAAQKHDLVQYLQSL
jgi:mono/diheme cytochrome c family protein